MKILSTLDVSLWTCQSACFCGTIVELTSKDLSFVADSREGNYYTWKCPTCDRENGITESLIPQAVRVAIAMG